MKLVLPLALMLVIGLSISAQQGRPSAESPRQMGVSVTILSDTKGVDFNNYAIKLIATLRRNWEYSLPQPETEGRKGVVYITFQIDPDGSVPAPDPILERSSGEKALDTLAMVAVKASNPFEPLPSQFHDPFLRLRVAFIYKGT